MSVADKTQFPMDLEEVVNCFSCRYYIALATPDARKSDFCTKKSKFVDYNKPCKHYENNYKK